MSFIGSSFSGDNGAGFKGQGANIQNPSTTAQADQLYGQTQEGLAQQQAFLQALQGQNGLQNQSDVYNQLAGIASGQGPNPAQAALANATGANVANQAALMAGQRGAGANPGLIARQAAMQGGALEQQAAGQGALMQAQQSMNAINAMGNIAGQQVSNQQGALDSYNRAAQNAQSNILNSIANQNTANVGMQSNINNVNAGIAQGNQKFQQGIIGGLSNAVGNAAQTFASAAPAAAAAHDGGLVEKYADGGGVSSPMSSVGRFLSGLTPVTVQQPSAQAPAAPATSDSPGAQLGDNMQKAAIGAGKLLTSVFKDGGSVKKPVDGETVKKVPGKAKVKGNSLKNDTVPALLSPGEVVIPKSVMESDDPVTNAAKFVAACMAKKSHKGR